MTKKQVIKKINEIIAKDPHFKDVSLKVHFKDKKKNTNSKT